jgi:chromosome condensin MukBEF MukE localization factor
MASMLLMVELLCDLYLETSMLDQEGMQRFRELKDCLQNLKANRPTGIMH